MDEMINICMKRHKHHIIPRHCGGDDSPENLVLLTIEEHAEAHRVLYEQYGRWQDRVAWLSLSGIMKDHERIYEIISNSNRGNPSGYRCTEEQKKRMSERMTGEKNPNYGKRGNLSPMTGTKRPGIGGRPGGKKWTDEERKVHMEARSKPGYYAYFQDPERNRKISEAKKGCIGSATGKTWFTNGTSETYAFECPDGYWKGRRPGRNSNKIGLVWFNNGVENKQFRIGTEPQGFIRGRICKKQ